MFVHVDKAVTFAVLTGGKRHAVDATPWRVAHQVYAIIGHRFHHFFDVGAQIVDAIVVVDAAVAARQSKRDTLTTNIGSRL